MLLSAIKLTNMKRTLLLLTNFMAITAMCVSGCDEKQTPSIASQQFKSINSPETKAYLHNATIKSVLAVQTRTDSDDDTVLPDDYIALTCEVLEAQARELGFDVSLTDEDVEHINNYVDDFNSRISNSVSETIWHYTSLMPFESSIKNAIYDLSINDIENGTHTTLDYVNNLLLDEEFSSDADLAQFCHIGNASFELWEELATRATIDRRGWLSTFADIAGSFFGAGLFSVAVSTIFSLNMSYGDCMSLEEAMDTNCD